MDFRHLIVTCLFSMLRLSFETQKIKENYAIFKALPKTSLFNLFCISFRTHLTFDKILIYNTLSLLPMIVMIDK